MKKRSQSFGFVFPITKGKHANKFMYCYKDKNGLNQHSKPFKTMEVCSQEFAQKFAEYIVKGMVDCINQPQEF